MDGWTIAMIVLLAISIFFILLGTIGLHRFPDVYTRLHAATKTTTFGSIFLIAAVIVYGAFRLTEVSGDNAGSFMHVHHRPPCSAVHQSDGRPCDSKGRKTNGSGTGTGGDR